MIDKNNFRIAILGATGHIAMGLIYNFSQMQRFELFLFARSIEKVRQFLAGINNSRNFHILDFSDFNDIDYDVIINCIGHGKPEELQKASFEIFFIAEKFDNMVLDYIEKKASTLYINLSSGIVYGPDFSRPAGNDTITNLNLNNIVAGDYYKISKIYSEAKHRSLSHLNIVDLRIFAYFSRFIDLNAQYLITGILTAICKKTDFITDANDIMRDYIHPYDFFILINKCIEKFSVNDFFDVYSLKPITKLEILEYFKKQYGLKYILDNKTEIISATGIKNNYYSIDRKANILGYDPQYTSMDCIIEESEALLNTARDI